LWINLNFIGQIESSYKNNFDDEYIHLPHYPPRTAILEKFLEYDLLISLKPDEQGLVSEIFAQLEELRVEFFHWKEFTSKAKNNKDMELYRKGSETLLSYINPTMQNMINLWIQLVIKYGAKSNNSQIQELNIMIKQLMTDGKWIAGCYRSSLFHKFKIDKKVNVIMCWIKDSKEKDIDIIELKNLVPLHDSWKTINSDD
jgi:hypothetical protein